MNVLPIVKGAVGLVTSFGAGAVVGNAIKATTPTDMKLLSKISVSIGGVALSSIAGDQSARYIGEQIQAIADNFIMARKVGKAAADFVDATADYVEEETAKHEEPNTPSDEA